MHPSNIVRVGVVCTALFVGACGFTPGKPVSGAGGAGNTVVTGIGNFGGSSSGQGGLTGQGGGQECGAVERPSSKLPPDILIVQDASGSMNQDSANATCQGGCGANSKWALMIPAINQVVMETQAEVNWGLKMFADMGGQCGVNATTVAVGIAASNAAPIQTALMGRTDAAGNVTNGSSTPTRAAMNAATTYLMARAAMPDFPNPKFVVLATDGQPNCPMSGQSSADDGPGAIAAVMAARTAGFPTFVVGIAASGTGAETTLNSMADAGGYPQMNAATRYYGVTDTAGFATVLRTLVGMATTCTFSVPPPPTMDGTTSRGDIKVQGTVGGTKMDIPQDANNGWTFTDANMTSVVLHGSACDQVTAGTITSVTIVFNCHIP
jgi:hypothetical protein